MDKTKLLVLAQLVALPGYRILLEYFEQGARDLEADLLNADPTKPEEIVARHRIVNGGWRLYHETKARIARDVASVIEPEPAELTEREKEELYLKSLSN